MSAAVLQQLAAQSRKCYKVILEKLFSVEDSLPGKTA
jgi:hypothetical protein